MGVGRELWLTGSYVRFPPKFAVHVQPEWAWYALQINDSFRSWGTAGSTTPKGAKRSASRGAEASAPRPYRLPDRQPIARAYRSTTFFTTEGHGGPQESELFARPASIARSGECRRSGGAH